MSTILVVDDDPDILDAIEMVLEDEGYDVVTSEQGAYVEQLEKEKIPDLLVLDVMLSGRDGRELCRKLRQKEETKNLPVVMISAHPSMRKSVLEVGANEFLAKPFRIEKLLETIENYVSV